MRDRLFSDEIAQQQEYYSRTASKYEELHNSDEEHQFALAFLRSVLLYFSASSLLDVGSGTGRVIRWLKNNNCDENLKIMGIEPVAALRDQAYQRGLSREELIAGDATHMRFADETFDFVCAFGVLHHVKNPDQIINEMVRVARIGVFISDMNNFGCGTLSERILKQLINMLGLWRSFQLIKTRGKGFKYSEGDGIHYSYSVYDNYKQISKHCSALHILNTGGKGRNPYRSCSHVALVGIKKGVHAPPQTSSCVHG